MFTIYHTHKNLNNGQPIIFYDDQLNNESYMLTSAKLDLSVGTAGSFDFSIPPTNIAYDTLVKLTSYIDVYRNNDLIFTGRVIDEQKDYYGNLRVNCEGMLAVFNDSYFPPKTYPSITLKNLVREMLTNHNNQVSADKQVSLGSMTVDDDTVYRAYENYELTIDRLKDLVDSYGGYMSVRKTNGKLYFDWTAEFTEYASQNIDFGKNLIDLTQDSSADDLITVLVPLGAESENGEGRVTIASVNGGSVTLEDADAIDIFGRVVGIEIWDDVTIPANLKAKGRAFLNDKSRSRVTINAKAVDMAKAGSSVEAFKIGQKVKTSAAMFGVDTYFVVMSQSLDLMNPASNQMVLGDKIVGYIGKTQKPLRGPKGENGKLLYGTCSTDPETDEKVVICEKANELYAGLTITVKFATTNTSVAPTLNVNNLGAKPIWVDNAVTSTSNSLFWAANAQIMFVYNGTVWTVADQPAIYYGTSTTEAENEIKESTIATAVTRKGTMAVIRFLYGHNTTMTPALYISGDAAQARNILLDGLEANISNGIPWTDGETVILVFNGQYWQGAENSTVDGGGRNLAAKSEWGRYSDGNVNVGDWVNVEVNGYKINVTGDPTDLIGIRARNITGRYITFSYETNLMETTNYYAFKKVGDDNELVTVQEETHLSFTSIDGKVSYTLLVPTTATVLDIGFGFCPYASEYYIKNPKVETGIFASDWTPAPEDLEASISDVKSDLSEEISNLHETFTTTIEHYATKEETDTLVSSTVGELQKQIYGDDETVGEITRLETLINQTAGSVEIVTSNQTKFADMVSTFSFEGNTFKIITKDAEIHSEQGADFYLYIDKANNTVFAIGKEGTTASQANVTGQIGIGDGSVEEYHEQWAIRKGAYISNVGYNLDFVWVGGN